MRCKACGTENIEGATVCSSCGERLGGSAGAQVWPKNSSKLTEFRPTVEEKEELERVRSQLDNAINSLEGVANIAPAEKAEAVESMEPVAEPAPSAEPEIASEPEPIIEEKAADLVAPLEAALPEEPEEPVQSEPEQVEVEVAELDEPMQAVPEQVEVVPVEPGEPIQTETPESASEVQDEDTQTENSSEAEPTEPKKSNRLLIGIIAAAIVVAAIIGIVWFVGQQSGQGSPTDVKSYAGEWVLVEGDDPSLSRSSIADLKDRGLECTLVLKDDGSGTLVLFASNSMGVEWSIDKETQKAKGTVEDASTFDLQLTDTGIALVDTTGKAMYFERK